jgi:hypothetical protein
MWSHHENTILSAIVRQLAEDANPPADAADLSVFLKTLIKNGAREMVDLCVMAEKAFFHPDTKGSNSIKQVLPAALKISDLLQNTYSKPIYGAPKGIKSHNFASQPGYIWLEKDLKGNWIDPYALLKQDAKNAMVNDDDTSIIADGGAAATAYARLQFETITDEVREQIITSLLRYCELDTLAMVMIVQAWEELCEIEMTA